MFVGCLKAQGMPGLEVSLHSNSSHSYLGIGSAYWKGIYIKRQGMRSCNCSFGLFTMYNL